MNITSPVTGKNNVSIVKKIDTSKVISIYKESLQLNVRRFFDGLDTISLCLCNDTGYRFYHPATIFGDDQFYQELEKFEEYYPSDKWEYQEALRMIGEGEKVLEIGCGEGYFMQLLSAKNCAQLKGLELNTKAIEVAEKKGLDVTNAFIEDFAAQHPGSFDVVCAFQVLEHIYPIQQFVSAALKALKPGGKLIICVPNNNPYLYKHDFFHTLNLPPHHAGLWNRQTFGRLPTFFPMKLDTVSIEPLTDYKVWYQTQVAFLKEKGNSAHRLLSMVPRPVYKCILKTLRHFIEGRNILVKFVKN